MFPKFDPDTEARLQEERAKRKQLWMRMSGNEHDIREERKFAIAKNWHELKPEDHDKPAELVEMKVREFEISYHEIMNLEPWNAERFLEQKLRENGFDPTAMVERTDDKLNHKIIIRQYYTEEME